MIQHIQKESGLKTVIDQPTVIYEDNRACIHQVKEEYIKGQRTNHIAPKIFFTHELRKMM